MSVLQKKISKWCLWDGVSLLAMGGLSLLGCAIWSNASSLWVGVALVILGGIELRGRGYLNAQQPSAMKWLVGSQMGVLFVIISYCLRNIYYPPALPFDQMPREMLAMLENMPGWDNSGGDLAGMLQPLMKMVYVVAMVVSVFYQGSMAMYYLRKVPLALEEPPPLPHES